MIHSRSTTDPGVERYSPKFTAEQELELALHEYAEHASGKFHEPKACGSGSDATQAVR